MSLKDSWLAGRLHRQQELTQRQQDVQQTLVDLGQERQQMAARLHSNLALFRQELSQQEHGRQLDFQMFRAELQSFYEELQANVRSLQAEFSDELSLLKAETQTFLTSCQHRRLQGKAETRYALAAFMEDLRSDIQSYLAELEHTRQDRAEQMQQDLQQSRANREADVAALFVNLAEFRAELQHFRQSLSNKVWGQSASNSSSITQMSPAARVTAMPANKPATTKPAAKSMAISKITSAKTTSLSRGAASKSATKTAVKTAPASKVVAATKVNVAQAPSSPQTTVSEVAFEKEVYTFLHEHQGARLTQIESSLNLNRFQAVDALRSLIKKGLITQRDRVYLTQPDLTQPG